MSASANWDRTWGHKAMYGSAFAQVAADVIDVAVANSPNDDFDPYVRLAEAFIKQAMLEAEDEVRAYPDWFGPQQEALLCTGNATVWCRTMPDDGSDLYLDSKRHAWTGAKLIEQPNTVTLFCRVLDIDPEIFRELCGTILDRIADQFRAERAATRSAEVICFAEARTRREAAAARDAQFTFIPVHSRGRHIGDQLAMGF